MTVRARFIVSTVGTALFSYIEVEVLASHLMAYYYKRSASFSDKAFGIVYQESDYWIGPLAELRIITISLI